MARPFSATIIPPDALTVGKWFPPISRVAFFEMLMEDLSSLCTGHGHLYELRAIRVENGKAILREVQQPGDFIVGAEEFGVPQRRHRVIIVGIRSDFAAGASGASIDVPGVARPLRMRSRALPRYAVASAAAMTARRLGATQ